WQRCQVKGKRVQLEFVFWGGGFGVCAFLIHHGSESKPVWSSLASCALVLSIRDQINFLIPRSINHPRMAASTSANAIWSNVLSSHPEVKYPMAIEYAAQMPAETKSRLMNFTTCILVAPAIKFTATLPPGIWRAVIITSAPECSSVARTPPM